MCSPSEVEKLFKDDILYKQYILQKLSKIEKQLENNCGDIDAHSEKIDEIVKDLEEVRTQLVLLSDKVDKLQNDLRFFKKLIAALITIIGSIVGIQHIQ